MRHEKTFDELMSKILSIFPDAGSGLDNDGQLIIYTGYWSVKDKPETYQNFEPDEE